MKINIEKLAEIGTEVKQGNIHQIHFENLQRFVDYELSHKSLFNSQKNANFTYCAKSNEWFGDSSFNETEKQKMIQAILIYEPSDNEIKEVPSEIIAPALRPEMSQNERYEGKKFDCETAEDRYYQGV